MPTIEIDLKEIFDKIDNRLERMDQDLKQEFSRLNQRLDKVETSLTELKIDVGTIKVEMVAVKEDVKDLKNTQRSQLWALIITIIGAITAAIVRFGIFPNP